MRLEKTYSNFTAMRKHLTSNKADTLTFAVDQMLLSAHTLSELLVKIGELKKEKFPESKDFRTKAIIKKHIRYRQTHNHIRFSLSKANKVRMTGINYEEVQKSLF